MGILNIRSSLKQSFIGTGIKWAYWIFLGKIAINTIYSNDGNDSSKVIGHN